MPQYPIAPRDLLLQVARDLIMKGWQPVWCPQRQSGGFSPIHEPHTTGYDAPFPTVVPQPPGAHRLGFRPPPDVVIIDVDHYDGKRGADTIDKAEAWLGDLPPTYKVTSRGYDDPSGRLLFRKPADLDFSDRALAQFADEQGKTSVEILRTGHRFSWAPGDINHKNGLPVQCFDPLGEPCLLPSVTELPELPERWVTYLRQPPAVQSTGYTRPGDGPQWWLAQPDDSLGSDDELKSFAFNMMLSRVPLDEVFSQWLRVAHDDDPGWPWSREDFDRHTRSQAQAKADQQIAREDADATVFEGIAGGQAQLNDIAQRQTEQYEREQKLTELREQRIAETIAAQQMFPVQPLEEDTPRAAAQPFHEYLKELTRGFPEFTVEVKKTLIRELAKEDVLLLLTKPFIGFRDISQLEEPPEPEMLIVTGKPGTPNQAIVARGTVTSLSGHRGAGKTWAGALWAEQQVRRTDQHIVWIDFERQERGLNEKFRHCGLSPDRIRLYVHYASEPPDLPYMMTMMEQTGPVLMFVDAFRGLQARIVPGSTANDGDAVEQVYQKYLNPLTEAGATIVLLDHMPKAGATTFGSERKESAPDYVIQVEQVAPFTKTSPGYSLLTVTKDRYGAIEAGAKAGYLWMPGDGRDSGKGIEKYPVRPEFRFWPPEAAATLADLESADEQGRAKQLLAVMVSEDRLRLSIGALCKAGMTAYPELFTSESKTKRWIRELVTDGQLTREAGTNGKLDVPVMEVHSPVTSVRAEDLEHQDG